MDFLLLSQNRSAATAIPTMEMWTWGLRNLRADREGRDYNFCVVSDKMEDDDWWLMNNDKLLGILLMWVYVFKILFVFHQLYCWAMEKSQSTLTRTRRTGPLTSWVSIWCKGGGAEGLWISDLCWIVLSWNQFYISSLFCVVIARLIYLLLSEVIARQTSLWPRSYLMFKYCPSLSIVE